MRGLSREPLLLWGAGIAVALAAVLPVVYLVIRTAGAGDTAVDAIFQARTLAILWRTAQLVALVTAGSVALAIPLALLSVRTDLPFRRAWAVVSVLPLVIPSYVGAFTVISAFGPRGLLQGWLEGPLGVQRLPSIYGLGGAAVVLTLLSYPYVFLTVRAALWRLEPELEEASRSLGHGSWSTFRRVTLPLLWPAVAGGALLVALYTLSDFGAVSILQYETFTKAIYVQYESAFDRTLAAALSLVLVGVAVALVVAEASARRRAGYYTGANAARRERKVLRLGAWRWPAAALAAGIALLAIGVPVSVLAYWLVRGISAGEPLLFQWSPAWASVRVASLAAAATVIAGLPIAILAVRRPGLVSGILERMSYAGFAMPGIAVALALVFFGVNYALPLYQSVTLLVFAYAVLFLPAAVGSIRASLLQVSPRMEEAALTLGRSRLGAFLSVTLPLIWPGLAAGAAMVFLLTMKELPATLILGPIGFKTLATSIWTAAEEAFFARAAAPALLLVLVSAAPMTFLMMREGRPSR